MSNPIPTLEELSNDIENLKDENNALGKKINENTFNIHRLEGAYNLLKAIEANKVKEAKVVEKKVVENPPKPSVKRTDNNKKALDSLDPNKQYKTKIEGEELIFEEIK